MRILLTGTAGFVGSNVARQLLAEGVGVVGIVKPGENLGRILDIRESLKLHECDLGDRERVAAILQEERPDTVIHLAWYTSPGKYWRSAENLDCVEQGLGLARAAGASGCRRFVGAGTCAEYDWSFEKLSEESTPCRPRTLYGAAKHALFLMLEKFFAGTDVSFAWVRYNFIYGPGEQPGRLVSGVIEELLDGRDVPCTEGRQRRDFLHVSDVASATIAVTRSSALGPVNIGSGTVVEVRFVVQTLAEIIGGPGKPVFGARPSPSDEPPALVANTERLGEEIGWHPDFDLEAGLRQTVEAARRSEQ